LVERGQGDEWHVSIRTQNGAGVSDRLLFARSCDALADATSLIVAMQIDPETAAIHARVIDGLSEPVAPAPQASLAPPGVYSAPLPPPASTAAHSNAAVSETKTIERNPEPHAPAANVAHARALVGVAWQRDWGSLPAASDILEGALAVAVGPWWGEFGVGLSSREDIAQSAAPAIGSVRMLTGTLRACRRVWEQAALGVSPCLSFEWARWSSEGNSNLNAQRSDAILTSAVTLRWVGTVRIFESLSLMVPVDVVVPLSRPRFGFVEAGEWPREVFKPYWIALRAGAGVQLYFP
jgi:hypothetical protein